MPIPDNLKSVVTNLPESPGIYKFFDEKNRLLYIGKSKNLRSRIRTYFRKQSNDVQERTLRMIYHINEIQIEQTETELEALILEDNLIKQHLPPYNIKQKKFKEQVYITVTTDKFPAFKIIVNEEIDFTEQLFGPFKDKYAAENILLVINKILKLRSCNDPIPSNKCMLAGISKCLGPCKNDISDIDYNKIVQIALDFLNGKVDAINEVLDRRILEVADKLEFEEAAEFRDLKDFCLNFCKRQEFMQDFMNGNIVIRKDKLRFVFAKGELKKIYKKKVAEIRYQALVIESIIASLSRQFLLDRAYVVWVWVIQNEAVCFKIVDTHKNS